MSDDKPTSALSGLKVRVRKGGDAIAAMPTRRKLLIGGGTAAAGIAIVAATSNADPNYKIAARKAEPDDITPVGDGFVLVDGWVLPEDELPKS